MYQALGFILFMYLIITLMMHYMYFYFYFTKEKILFKHREFESLAQDHTGKW